MGKGVLDLRHIYKKAKKKLARIKKRAAGSPPPLPSYFIASHVLSRREKEEGRGEGEGEMGREGSSDLSFHISSHITSTCNRPCGGLI